MSHALYFTRLFWDGRRGVAKLHGRLVQLGAAPVLPGTAIELIDYAPEVCCCEILRAGERRRDMTTDEIRGADALLVELTKEVRDAPAA